MLTVMTITVACGSGDDGSSGDDDTNPTMCGVAGARAGDGCLGAGDCGSGSGNFRKVEFCSACPSRVDSQFCEAGVCRDLQLVDVTFSFGAPEAARGAKSYTITSFSPTMADGGTLTCAALLSSCTFLDNDQLNAANSRHARFTGESADPALVEFGAMSFDVGSNRILFVQAMSDRQGNGTVVANKCVEGIEVKASGNDMVFFDLDPV